MQMFEAQTAIEVSHLNKWYGKNQVLNDVSFAVPKGCIFGFLGPNGSGKSTTIKILCGLIAAQSGQASILGYDVQQENEMLQHQIGYMSQKFSLYDDLTVFQNLKFYAGLYGISGDKFDSRLTEVVELTRIHKYLDRKAGFLSGGWKQRLALGCAIIHQPPILFLDEPTAGIDPVARRDLWDLLFDLSSQGVTMFVTTHYMDEAERCHQVAYIYEGKLIANGTSQELRALESITPPNSRRLELICSPLMKAYRTLQRFPYVLDSTVFGASLHMILDNQVSDIQFIRSLSELGFSDIALTPITPSLEDVFVTLTQQAISEREKAL
jgi:ABC-type multidrug transport system ATPase subunit